MHWICILYWSDGVFIFCLYTHGSGDCSPLGGFLVITVNIPMWRSTTANNKLTTTSVCMVQTRKCEPLMSYLQVTEKNKNSWVGCLHNHIKVVKQHSWIIVGDGITICVGFFSIFRAWPSTMPMDPQNNLVFGIHPHFLGNHKFKV